MKEGCIMNTQKEIKKKTEKLCTELMTYLN